jgi:hypothetical protein
MDEAFESTAQLTGSSDFTALTHSEIFGPPLAKAARGRPSKGIHLLDYWLARKEQHPNLWNQFGAKSGEPLTMERPFLRSGTRGPEFETLIRPANYPEGPLGNGASYNSISRVPFYNDTD